MQRRLDQIAIDQMLEAAGLRNSRGMQALARAALISGGEWRRRFETQIERRLATAGVMHPFAPSPESSELSADGLQVGTVVLADGSAGPIYRITLDDLILGTFVGGAIGQGKSSLVYGLCEDACAIAPVWVFDREGDASQKLASAIRSGRFRYMHFRDLRRNLFEPLAGETEVDMMTRTLSVWRGELTLGAGSESILARSMSKMLEESGEAGYVPTIFHLMRQLSTMKRYLDARERMSWDTLWRAVMELMTLMRDVYDVEHGVDISELMATSVIFDMRGAADTMHRFFLSDLVSCAMAIREYQMWS